LTRHTPNQTKIHALLSRDADQPLTRSAFGNTLTFARRAILKIRHTPEQAFDVIVMPIMLAVIFTNLLGGALAGSTDAYLAWLLPGIMVQTVMFAAIYTGFNLNQDIQKGVFDRFRTMPLWRPAPIAGALLGDMLRHSVSAMIVLLAGLIMGYRPETGALGVLAVFAVLNLFALGIGWAFTFVALIVRTPGTFMTLSWLLLMPLAFASNIYVDPATMSGWLQAFVNANPVSHLVTALRALFDGTVEPAVLMRALFAPLVVASVGMPLTMWLFNRER
jgi:ABC-2 type transport system permease protein